MRCYEDSNCKKQLSPQGLREQREGWEVAPRLGFPSEEKALPDGTDVLGAGCRGGVLRLALLPLKGSDEAGVEVLGEGRPQLRNHHGSQGEDQLPGDANGNPGTREGVCPPLLL